MGKPVSWKGEVMKSHLLMVSRGISAAEAKVIEVLRAGYTDQEDFIQAFGDLLEFLIMARNGKDDAVDVMRTNYFDSKSFNELEEIDKAINKLERIREDLSKV